MPTRAATENTGLDEFLKRHPWPAEWKAMGQRLEWHWTYELKADPEHLWERIADTSSFNARLGLPEMKLEERKGKLHGRSKNLGMLQEWEEVPWEWAWGRGLSNARIYSKGLAKLVRSRYELEATPSGGTKMTVYFGWIPRNALGRFLLNASTKWMRESYARVLDEIDAELAGRPSPVARKVSLSKEQEARIADAVQALKSSGVEKTLLKRVETFLLEASDDELARIKPRRLAHQWNVALKPLIRLLLLATRKGLLRLTWDLICPHCRGVRQEVASLGTIPQNGSCEACGIDFDATNHRNLEVTFHVHPSLREAMPRFYCAAEPARKPHMVMRCSLEPGEQRMVRVSVMAGRYRVRGQGATKAQPLEILAGASSQGNWTLPGGMPPLSLGVGANLELRNEGTQPQAFVMEQWESDREALRPGELFNFQDFRDLFSEECVASGVKLDVGDQCILFTDIVGSTKFYQHQGDSVAFARVREHFLRIYDAVREENGAIVKTIGDACMAAFNEPHKALRAALEIQRSFPDNGGIRLRVSLHQGPCLAVNLNSLIDYFGNTVNYAAKLQSSVHAGEVVFSGELESHAGVREVLKEQGFQPESFLFHRSWDGKDESCFRLKVS